MIVLSGTAITLQLTTSAAVAVDVLVAFFDASLSVAPPSFATNTTRTNITTAATTPIAAAPGAGVTREIKYVSICAKGGACVVKPFVFDTTNSFQCVGDSTGVPLAVGETLEYTDSNGWQVKDVNGSVKYVLGPTLNGHIIKDNGTARTQRASLNTLTTDSITFSATDDSINNKTDLSARPSGKGTDNAGGAAITMGAGDTINLITSTTAITSFVFTNDFAGRKAVIVFATARTVTHNSTSLILPTGANISANPGDIMEVESLGSGNFRVNYYMPTTGVPIALALTQTTAQSQTATSTNVSPGVLTIPAAAWQVGSDFEFSCLLHWSRGATATASNLVIELNITGFATLTRSITLATVVTLSAFGSAIVKGKITCRTVGGAGTAMITLTAIETITNASTTPNTVSPRIVQDPTPSATANAPTTINTTVSGTVELRARHATTGIANLALHMYEGTYIRNK